MLGLPFVDDVNLALPSDNLIIWTDFFDACLDFHLSLVPVGNPTFG